MQPRIEKDAKLAGDDISFVEMLDFQDSLVPITYTGKVAGDEIRFAPVVPRT